MEKLNFSRTPEGRLNLNSGDKLLFAARHGEQLRKGDAGPASLVHLAANDLNHAAHKLAFTTGRPLVDCIKHLMQHDDMAEWFRLGRLHPQPDEKFSTLVTFEAQ